MSTEPRDALASERDRIENSRDQLVNGTYQALRERAGLTQTELGDLIGLSQTAVSLYENGLRAPSEWTAWRYAHVMADIEARLNAVDAGQVPEMPKP